MKMENEALQDLAELFTRSLILNREFKKLKEARDPLTEEEKKILDKDQQFIDMLFAECYKVPYEPRIILTKDDYVGREVGYVFNVSDYYFHSELAEEALEIGATSKEVFEHYDFCLKNYDEGKELPSLTEFINKRKEKC